MKNIDQLQQAIQEAAHTIVSNQLDLLYRERKMIHVDVLKEYFLSDEKGKKRLIDFYGTAPFLFFENEDVAFAVFLLRNFNKTGQTLYPFNSQGKRFYVKLSVTDDGKEEYDPELLQKFKDFLNRNK